MAVVAQMPDERLEVGERERPGATARADRRDDGVVTAKTGHILDVLSGRDLDCGAPDKCVSLALEHSRSPDSPSSIP
jgi:hypothetical protein